MIPVTNSISLAESELEFAFTLASGPGGQNVNRVATAVQLRFAAAASPSLPEPVRARLRRLAGRRMTTDGVLVIEARRFRSQARNRDDAVQRLVRLIQRAACPPKPRKPTKPSAGSVRQRLQSKRNRALTKRLRNRPAPED